MKSRRHIGSVLKSLAALLALLGSTHSLRAASVAWDNSGTDFNAGTSWVGDNAPGTADRAVFNTAAVTQPNLSGDLTIQGLSFTVGGYTVTSGGSALTLTATGTGAAESSAAVYLATGIVSTVDAPVILGGAAGATQAFRVMDTANVTFNRSISSTNAISGLNLTGGAGTVSFNVSNTYNGTTTVGASITLIVGHSQALSAGTLVLNGSQTGLQAGTDLTGANKLNNNIVLQSAETWLRDSGANAIEFGGSLDLNGGTGSAKLIKSQISGGATFNGVISNDNGRGVTFQLSNNSNITLNAVNTYTGNTGINGTGAVRVSSIGNAGVAGNLGAGSSINLGSGISGGKLIYTGTGENTSKAINLVGASSTVEHAGTGLLNFTSDVIATTGGNRTLTLDGSTAGTGQISGAIVNPAGNSTSVVKNGTGTWILSGTNAYSGSTTINGGVLEATDGAGLPIASVLQMRGGVLQTNGTFNRTLGTAAGNVNWTSGSGGFAARGGNLILNLNGGTGSLTWGTTSTNVGGNELILGSSTADSRVDLQNSVALGGSARTIRVNDNASSSTDVARISGALSGAGGGIVKEGSGVLELTGTNNYTGNTTVNAGTLLINGNMSAATGGVTVASGATLGGSGTIGGATVINGFLSAGNSPGTLTFNSSLTLNSSSQSLFEIDGPSLLDYVVVGTSLTYGGSLVLDMGFTPSLGMQFNLFDFSTQSGSFSSISFLNAGYDGTFDYDTGVLTVTAIPEPSVYALLVAGLGILLWRGRRSVI